jgi:hydroxymethylpyrimidine/phosphomethylpyrimidine kinase
MQGRVLVVAGSDSGGGAGIQADIKTITALGAYAAAAITAVTAQNTLGVAAVHVLAADLVRLQIALVLDDIGADAIKIGMLGSAEAVEAVSDVLAVYSLPIVLDPVIAATTGSTLLVRGALDVLKRRLLPMATVVTPNLQEAEALLGKPIKDIASMRAAASAILALGAGAVLLKGAHLPGDTIVDLLATADGIEAFAAPRIESNHTHGTGCTLASAVAAGLAQGRDLRSAVQRGRAFVRAAIAGAPGFGAGNGPLDHTVTLDQVRLAALG